MTRFTTTPPVIRRACDLLDSLGICRIVRPIDSIDDVLSRLTIAVDVPHPNTEGLPSSIELECLIGHPYPFGEIEFTPKGDEVRGFPHQAADGGKLCLPSAQDAPWDESRLLKHVQWTKEWLTDAANGQLLKLGDPYELPDFRHRKFPDPTLEHVPPIVFDESATSFPCWDGRVGQSGEVSFVSSKCTNVIAAVDWLAADKSIIRRVPFSSAFLWGGERFTGQWALLPALTSVRVRPPRTYEELTSLFRVSHIDLEKVLRRAWALGRSRLHYGVVLLGCPIPTVVGGPPTEVHWQPLLLPNMDATRQKYKGRGKRDEGLLWRVAHDTMFAPSKLVIYGHATNVAVQRQYARGPAPSFASREAIAVVGAGAIGSLLAETFARAGVSPLSIVDDDRVEFGNLCRHTLDGSHVGQNKAVALAARLSSANPFSVVEAYTEGVPFSPNAADALCRALTGATTLVDCSTDHGAFLWLSTFARQNGKRLASLFINRDATLLTLVLSGRNIKAKNVFTLLNRAIVNGSTSIDPAIYLGTADVAAPLLPGPGCWHPTFPGRNNHIAMLVAAAVDCLYDWLQQPYRCDGRALVFRRSNTSPLIDVAFDRMFR